MQFPKEILDCVVFLGYTNEEGERRITGTAFIVSKQIADSNITLLYLVTAYHNIYRATQKNLENIQLRLNLTDGSAVWIDFPLDEFNFHPDQASGIEFVDVAVAPIHFSRDVDYARIPITMFANNQTIEEEQIGLGDDIAIVGLFTNHIGRMRNEPIVRIGNICAMPKDKVVTEIGNMHAYLIEARSIGGLSGSPVFAYMSYVRGKLTTTRSPGNTNVHYNWEARGENRAIFYCIGLVHGHFDTRVVTDTVVEDINNQNVGGRDSVNVGVAIVTPSTKILETLNQPLFIEMEKQIEDEYSKQFMPVMDNADEKVEPEFTVENFENALKLASRKISELVEEKKETSE